MCPRVRVFVRVPVIITHGPSIVAVSTTKVTTYRAQSTKAVLSRNGKTINILAVDVGMVGQLWSTISSQTLIRS